MPRSFYAFSGVVLLNLHPFLYPCRDVGGKGLFDVYSCPSAAIKGLFLKPPHIRHPRMLQFLVEDLSIIRLNSRDIYNTHCEQMLCDLSCYVV